MKTERRAIARHHAKLFVEVEMSEYRFDATTTEISLQGLRILCEGPIANTVFNQYIQVTPGENVSAKIEIKITSRHGLAKNIRCEAMLISVNRIAQNSYMIGFKIIELDAQCQEDWQAYIADLR